MTIAPPQRTEQATVQIRASGEVVNLPVTVTITNAPFIRASDTTLLYRIPGDSSSQTLSVWIPNARTPMPFSAASNSPWLSVNPAGGAGYTDLGLQINPANLTTGDYFGSVTLAARGAANSPIELPVRMAIVPLTMWSQPQALVFSQAAGGPAPPSQVLAVLTSGPPVTFAITTDAAWLSTSPSVGTTPAQISVSANGAGLSPGTYRGNVTASGPGAAPLIVPVTFTVEPENLLVLAPQDFNFYYWPGIASIDQVNSADMNITSTRPLKWTAVKSTGDWFYFANYVSTGTSPYRLVIGIAWGSLMASGPVPIGVFNGSITVSSPEATNSPQISILHGYSLPAAPLDISRVTVPFQSQGVDPPPSTVSVNAPSSTVFRVSVPSTNTWLSVSQSSESTPAVLTFSVKTAALQSGTYGETVTLYAQQAEGAPIPMHINVTLFFVR
jgi:hypothetical protein